MIIERPELVKRIQKLGKWALVYGRRKTGKTFIVRNFLKYDEYFFVKRDRNVLREKGEGSLAYDAFMEVFRMSLEDGKTVVVDEFHRLGDDFLDYLHYSGKKGKLILVSSTLSLSKKLVSSKSPLLGLVSEMPVSLIRLKDCIRSLKKHGFGKKPLLEYAILVREPLAIEYLQKRMKPREAFSALISASVKTVPALVGEIFREEGRSISAIYEGVLRAIAQGKTVSGEISSYLFSRRLIGKDDPSSIQQYLNNLMEFGIIRRIAIYGKKRYVYRHTSALARLFYYADEKYNISEGQITEERIGRVVDELLPRIVEDELREFLALEHGLEESVVETPDYDIDACLLKFRKPEIAVEVKWKGHIKKKELLKAEENLWKVDAKERLLFVPDKKGLESEKVKIVDVSDFL